MGRRTRDLAAAPLGPRPVPYTYAPAQLFAVAAPLSGRCFDSPLRGRHWRRPWTAYRLTWLDPQGKPVDRHRDAHCPRTSPFYRSIRRSINSNLVSFAQSMFASSSAVRPAIQRDPHGRRPARLCAHSPRARSFAGERFASFRRSLDALAVRARTRPSTPGSCRPALERASPRL